MINRICVFCGSSPGGSPNYNQAAISLGQELARQRIGLVYGGGKVGMMGAIAQAVLESGAGDIVLVAGKGHETWQETRGRKIPFSDEAAVNAALEEAA